MDCDLLSVPLWAKAECGGWYPTRSNTSRYWWVLRGVPRGCVCLKQCPPSARLKRSERWTQGGNACAQQQRRPSRSSPTAPPRLTPEPWPSDGVHVLVVEDTDDSRDMLRVALEYCGALVMTAASVEEALQILGTLRPHVLVTDISMPDDGLPAAALGCGRGHARTRSLGVSRVASCRLNG